MPIVENRFLSSRILLAPIKHGRIDIQRAGLLIATRHHSHSPRRYSSGHFADEFKRVYELPKLPRFAFSKYIQNSEWEGQNIHAIGYLKRVIVMREDEMVFARMVGPKDWGNSLQLITRQHIFCKLLQETALNSPISIIGNCRLKHLPKKTEKSCELEMDCPPEFTPISRLEIDLSELIILNSFPEDVKIHYDQVFLPSSRHMQIRYDHQLRERLIFRSSVAKAIREFLRDFQEVETPILFKSTPEGAKEFLVPSRKYGHAYALPQSPQQFKQVLIASGIEKYFQFARCFRDEDLRADRQPEFTQVDLEVAFADGNRIMNLVETLIKKIYLRFSSQIPKLVEQKDSKQKNAFPVMTYQEAMSRHGSDKPDLRIPGQIVRIDRIISKEFSRMITRIHDPIVEVTKFRFLSSPRIVQKFVKNFMDSPDSKVFMLNQDGAPGFAIYDYTKPISGLQMFGFEGFAELEKIYNQQPKNFYFSNESHTIDQSFLQGDLFVVQARQNEPHSGGSTMLGKLRVALFKAAIKEKLIEPDLRHHYLWVTDFPLFTLDKQEIFRNQIVSKFSATHHPFTAPKTAVDVDLLFSEPLKATAEHFDLVVNGIEIGGGSRRIHVAEMQIFVMKNILGLSEECLKGFSHLFDALAAGCPPHAGIALGFDRLMAILTSQDSVKDVIAFPKSSKGDDMLFKTPSPITNSQLERYHLALKNCPGSESSSS